MHLLVNELNEDEGYRDVELGIVLGTIWGTLYKEDKYGLKRMSQVSEEEH